MRTGWQGAEPERMTDTHTTAQNRPTHLALSRRAQLASAGSLAIGSLLIAVPQYVDRLWAGDLERLQRIRWGLAHPGFDRVEWAAAMVGSFLLLFGTLGLWHRTRRRCPRLTTVGAVVLTWGLSGQIFSDTATYAAQVVTAHVVGAADAERVIAKGYLHDGGMIAVVLVPVILGMLVGLGLLVVALWRSGFPHGAVVALALWPLWDFFGPSALGPLTADLWLAIGGVWLAVVLARTPREQWMAPEM